MRAPWVATLVVATCCAGACGSKQASESHPAPEPLQPVLLSNPEVPFDGSIRLAAIFPTQGRYGPSGIQSLRGVRLAVKDINAHGGINGRSLRLLEYRIGSYFVDARYAAERVVERAGAVAIIGSNSSSLSMPIAEVAEANGIVQVSNISTAQDLTHDPVTGVERRFVFRVCPSDLGLARLLARFASVNLKAQRVAVLYEVGRAYSARLAQNFVRAYEGARGKGVTEEFVFLPLETDFRPQLRQIAAFHPDLLFLPGSFTDATLVAHQATTMGLDVTMLGADGWSNRYLFQRHPPPGRAFYADLCSPPPRFQQRYQAVFDEEPDGCRAVLGYDAVVAVAQSLAQLGPLSDKDLRQGLAATRERLRISMGKTDIEGQTGRIRFDEHRDRSGGMAIMEVVRDDGHVKAPEPYLLDHAS